MAAKKGKKASLPVRLLKLFLFLLLIVGLIVGGFALGVYLQIVDSQEMNEKLGLYRLPVVGEYFVPPPQQPTQEEMENKPVEDVKPKADEKKKEDKQEKKQSKPVTLSKKEIEDQMKAREAAERKRISKIARLYNEMKPQEAADAMESLDDDLTFAILQRMDEGNAAKTLAKMDADKAARLTELIYEGKKKQVTLPSELEQKQNTEETAGE